MEELADEDIIYTLNRLTYTMYIPGEEFDDVNAATGWIVIIYNPKSKLPIVVSVNGSLSEIDFTEAAKDFNMTYKSDEDDIITFVRKGINIE